VEALDGGEELGDVGLVGGSGEREPNVGGGIRGGARIQRGVVPRVEEVQGERCEIWSRDSEGTVLGGDCVRLRRVSITHSAGVWPPKFFRDAQKTPAEFQNLNYIYAQPNFKIF